MRYIAIILTFVSTLCNGQLWYQIQDYPGGPRDNATAFSIGTKIYVGTGSLIGSALATDWFAFDIVGGGNSWSPVAPLPSTPRNYCTGIDGGYLFGGLDANGPLNELWKYDPSSNTWSQRASLPSAGRYGASTFTLNNRIFIANGMLANGIASNEFWEYDQAIDTWIQLPDVPGPARHLASSFINHPNSETHGYVVGGTDSTFQAFQDVWCFERTAEIWTQVAPMPEARYGAGSAYVLSGQSFDLGPTILGGASNDSIFHATGLIYEPGNDTWSDLGPLIPRGIRGGAMASASGGGGWNMTLFGGGLDSTFMRRPEAFVTTWVFGISESEIPTFALHPNPGTASFTIELPTALSRPELKVYDLSGRMVLQTSLLSFMIHASDWPPGSYTLLVTGSDNDRYRSRWVKL